MAKIITDEAKIQHLLRNNTEEAIVQASLEKKLRSGKKLRVKLGCDPSRPDLHLGHSIVIGKLREFQELGHQVVFIIGDYTAMIGDPSGKSKTRTALSRTEVKKNAKTYFKQVGKLLDLTKAEIRFNSEWHDKLTFEDILKLANRFTVARTLERDDFTKRMQAGTDIAVSEMLYPLMQAYDSVAIKADVEIGGTDQKFNLLAGRELQKKMQLPEQDIVTCPLLVGLDGKEKMSKSLDNYIGIAEKAGEMFGKLMSISDTMVPYYFAFLTPREPQEITRLKNILTKREQNPRDLKAQLAKEVVEKYHGDKAAKQAEAEFNRVFRDKVQPTQMPEMKIIKREMSLVELLTVTGLATSSSEARRLIEQGGVRVDKEIKRHIQEIIKIRRGSVLQVGKRKFLKLL